MLALLSLLILVPCSLGVVTASSAIRKEAASANVSFNITTENAMNANVIVLNVDKALSAKASATSIKWYVNDVEYVSWVQPFTEGDTNLTLTWGDAGSASASNLSHYVHYYIPSGTDFGGGYTLEKDYSFWWGHQSGGQTSLAWTFQNGGSDAIWNHAIPSIHIDSFDSDDSGAQDEEGRFVVNFNITKEAGVYSETSWNAANIMMASGKGDYSLYDYVPDGTTNVVYGQDGVMSKANKDKTSGTWGLLLYYSGLGIATGDNIFRSFYIPKGTLYGGFNENYGFYVDNDVYFDWTGSLLQGIYDGRHTYVKVPAKCGHPGNIEYYTCSRHEGEYFLLEDGKYVATTKEAVEVDVEHQYGVLIPEIPATCTTDGVKAHYKCSVCGCLFIKDGDTYTEVTEEDLVIKASHTFVHVDEVKPTCTTSGTREHYECSVCHKLFLLIDGSYIEVKAEELIVKPCHTLVVIKGKAATCTEEGLTDGLKCSVCGETVQKQIVIPALGHLYGGWNLLTKDDGSPYLFRICSRCGEEETVDVNEANGFTNSVIKEPTETESGIRRYYSETYGQYDVSLAPGSGKSSSSTNMVLIIVSSILFALAIGGGACLAIWMKKKRKEAK